MYVYILSWWFVWWRVCACDLYIIYIHTQHHTKHTFVRHINYLSSSLRGNHQQLSFTSSDFSKIELLLKPYVYIIFGFSEERARQREFFLSFDEGK